MALSFNFPANFSDFPVDIKPFDDHIKGDSPLYPDDVCGVDGCSEETKCLNLEGKFSCFCVDTLQPPFPNGSCPYPKTFDEGSDVADHAINNLGVIDHEKLKSIVGINKDNATDQHQVSGINKDNATDQQQNITRLRQVNLSGQTHSLTTLEIFIPLGVFLIVFLILSFLLMKKYKWYRQKKSESDSLPKSGDNTQLIDRMNIIHKNPTYFNSFIDGMNDKKFFVNRISLDKVKILENVGEGAFGQVFKGELYTNDEDPPTFVAVKVLKDGVTNEVRQDFEREVEIMCSFDHDNILKLIGIVVEDVGPTPYMLFEYMVYGDLAEMLRRNDPVLRRDGHDIVLKKTDLIDIATQIANGMMYLTSQHFVHRDLATRNCLVGDGLIVKISDFGMSRDIYTCDYYRIGGSRMLPVRWMSPESVKYGRFTSESDVWAFGVVLWEIFSFGRQPYYGHSNEEVVRFLDEELLLQRPDACPSTVYRVMLGCWKQQPHARFPFKNIHRHLVEYSKRIQRNIHRQQQNVETETEAEVMI